MALFAYAGVLYFTSATNEHNIDRAKSIFRHAFLGIVLALSAYLIVNTILHTIIQEKYVKSWNKVDCYPDSARKRDANIGDWLSNAWGDLRDGPQPPGVVTRDPTTGKVTITTVGPDGKLVTVSFDPSRPLSEMNDTYLRVLQQYESQIAKACAGSSLPDCQTVVTAVIVAESSGVSTCNSIGACGIMQSTSNTCALSDTQCHINAGVAQLSADYTTFGSLPNTFAAYNSGNSTVPGQSASGLNSALVTSIDCGSSYYAWQCSTNPGGLVETQQYVANICALLSSQGSGCQ